VPRAVMLEKARYQLATKEAPNCSDIPY